MSSLELYHKLKIRREALDKYLENPNISTKYSHLGNSNLSSYAASMHNFFSFVRRNKNKCLNCLVSMRDYNEFTQFIDYHCFQHLGIPWSKITVEKRKEILFQELALFLDWKKKYSESLKRSLG